MIRLSLRIGAFYLFDLDLLTPAESTEVHELEDSSSVAFGFTAEEPEVDGDWFEDVPDEMRKARRDG